MLNELSNLVENQKTITTKRLRPYVDRITEVVFSMNKRNHKLETKLNEMNRKYQTEMTKREKTEKKYKKLLEQYQELKGRG